MGSNSSVVLPARILDGLSTSVLLLGPELEVLHLNAAAQDLLGTSQKQAVGQPIAKLLHDSEPFLAVLTRARSDGQAYTRREIEVSFQSNQGLTIAVDFKVTPLRQPGAKRQLIVEIADATRRLRISRENALLNQHDASRTIVRQLAHEIKNPLGGLRGAAQLLDKELVTAELKEYTQIIISEADRLASLVDTLLGPHRPLRFEPVSIHEILQHVRQLLTTGRKSDVVIEEDFDPSLPPVEVDRDQIIQAVLNLATNATAAVSEGGHIVFRTRVESNFTIGDKRHRLVARVEIEDDGPGVPEEIRHTLFFPLVTGRSAGTGIGLAVAQELVNRHRGLIEYDSRPGCTVFRVMLPIATTQNP